MMAYMIPVSLYMPIEINNKILTLSNSDGGDFGNYKLTVSSGTTAYLSDGETQVFPVKKKNCRIMSTNQFTRCRLIKQKCNV